MTTLLRIPVALSRKIRASRTRIVAPMWLPLLLAGVAAGWFPTLAGCGYSGSAAPVVPVAMSGNVQAGHQPVSGATIRLYAAGTSGSSSAALALLSGPVKSNSSGNFTIPAAYTCPAASTPVFLTAQGGDPGLPSGGNNPALALMAMLGPCGNLGSVGSISMNEVTTVGSVWPLAQFMSSATDLGSTAADPNFLAAVTSIPEFINIGQGTSPGTPTATTYFAESAKLYNLANLIAACASSDGTASPCTTLFSMATPAGGSAPTDTLSAAITIAQNPGNDVSPIFSASSSDTTFQPELAAAPADWTLTLSYVVAMPTISLASGTYSGTQQVTLSDATAGATIYYTTDGSQPTSSSSAYTGPIAINASSIVQAVAALKGSQSGVAEATLTIAAVRPGQMLGFVQQPGNALAGATLSPAVQVAVEDSTGAVVSTANNAVTLTLTGGSGLTGTLTATAQNGVATFSNLSVSAAGAYSLVASSPGLIPATSATFTIGAPATGPAAAALLFLQQPSNTQTYAAISPAVQVAVVDSNGNAVTNAPEAITLVLLSETGIGGTLWTASTVNGVATFSNLTMSTAGSAYTLLASGPGLTSATSASFSVTSPTVVAAPAPAQLAFVQQPSNAVAGSTISPAVQVVVEDSNGNAVTTASNPVTLTLAGGTGLGGTLTVTPQNGIATFNNLTVSNAGTGYTLSASSPSLTPAVSSAFTISPSNPVTTSTAVKLAFGQQPSNAQTGATITPAITVKVEDANGAVVTTANSAVTLTLSAGTGLSGTLTATAQNGVATFSNVSVSNAGSADKLVAASPTLASATSANFTITAPSTPAPTATKLAFLQQPSNGVTGATLASVQVAVEDSNGNTVGGATNSVTLSLSSGSGLGGTLTVAAQNGVATFSTLTESVAGTYTLSAAGAGLTSATSTAFTISPSVVTPTASKLAFVQQPSNALTGAVLSPAITIAVEDANGNTVTSATNAVTIALSSGSGLGGTLTATPQNGIASFATLTESTAGSYTLSATSSGLVSATSATFTVSTAAASGKMYYLAPNGSDSNNGLSPTAAWLSPNHPLNCGDVISAAAGNYSNANFYTGKWGTVTCAAGNNVAWLQCATFDTCKISATANQGMWVDQSYWGVQGWEITTSASDLYGTCFIAQPNYAKPVEIHHIIFANDVANGCSQSGFAVVNHGAVGVDYFAVLGSIAYNAAQGSGTCASGISVYQPVQSDSLAGTHIYVAGNFSYGNLEPSMCNGTTPTDGEGIIFDTFDGSQGGLPTPYAAQAVAENNLVFNNGGKGVEVYNNTVGAAHASIYLEYNTIWGDLTDPNQNWTGCGEIAVTSASDTQVYNNLISTKSATGCGGHAIYALSAEAGDSSDVVNDNDADGQSGNNTFLYASGQFSFSSGNTLGVNPNFSNAVAYGAPGCGSAANVNSCMAPVINDFAPTTTAAQSYGYRTPSTASATDPLFPQWLCTANVPSGLITMNCN